MKQELKKKSLIMRWMDDLVLLVKGRLTATGKWALRRLQRKEAYGRGLQLLRTEGEEAFGFAWREANGAVLVSQEEKWVRRGDHPSGLDVMPVLLDGRSAMSAGTLKGTATGYFLRILDRTNKGEEDVGMMCKRLACELLESGHPRKELEEVARELKKQELCKVGEVVKDVVSWSAAQRVEFAERYDEYRESDRGIATEKRKRDHKL